MLPRLCLQRCSLWNKSTRGADNVLHTDPRWRTPGCSVSSIAAERTLCSSAAVLRVWSWKNPEFHRVAESSLATGKSHEAAENQRMGTDHTEFTDDRYSASARLSEKMAHEAICDAEQSCSFDIDGFAEHVWS